MIWECETTVIVMACNESESGKYKCESYWPQSPDEEQQYGNITGMSHPFFVACFSSPSFLLIYFVHAISV
jgi:protein tyrosine phosphatase